MKDSKILILRVFFFIFASTNEIRKGNGKKKNKQKHCLHRIGIGPALVARTVRLALKPQMTARPADRDGSLSSVQLGAPKDVPMASTEIRNKNYISDSSWKKKKILIFNSDPLSSSRRQCLRCHTACQLCFGATSSECTRCSTGSFLDLPTTTCSPM